MLLDGVKTKALLTDTQLFNLAEKLGKEWLKIAIANLKLNISEIDAIREKDVAVQTSNPSAELVGAGTRELGVWGSVQSTL